MDVSFVWIEDRPEVSNLGCNTVIYLTTNLVPS